MTLTCAWRKAAKMSAQRAFLSLQQRVLAKKTKCLGFLWARALRILADGKSGKIAFHDEGVYTNTRFLLFVPAKGAIQCATISSKKNAY